MNSQATNRPKVKKKGLEQEKAKENCMKTQIANRQIAGIKTSRSKKNFHQSKDARVTGHAVSR